MFVVSCAGLFLVTGCHPAAACDGTPAGLCRGQREGADDLRRGQLLLPPEDHHGERMQGKSSYHFVDCTHDTRRGLSRFSRACPDTPPSSFFCAIFPCSRQRHRHTFLPPIFRCDLDDIHPRQLQCHSCSPFLSSVPFEYTP